MKIAISTDGGRVSEHFGRCPDFTVVEIDSGKVSSKETVPNPGHHPGFLPQFFHEKGIEAIVAGGMGMRARELFGSKGIQVVLGVSGNVDDVIGKLAAGELEGGDSLCRPGAGKGYGVEKTECDHPDEGGDK